jgi:hypothetical protein
MSPRKKPTIKKIARTVYLPEPLNGRLIAEAERRGYSGNDLIIMALEQFLGGTPPPPPTNDDVASFD